MNSKNKNLLTLTRVVSALATTLLLVSFQPVPALAQLPNLTPAQEAQLRAMTPAQRQSLLNNAGSGQVGNISEPALSQPAVATPRVASGSVPSGIEENLQTEQAPDNLAEAPVAEATGQPLEQFGYSLFAGTPSTFAPATDIPIPSSYFMGPGDSVIIQMYGQENATYELAVTREGSILFPGIGPVPVVGLTFNEMREQINNIVDNQLIGQSAAVTLGLLRSIRIFILGEAFRPGSYTVSGLSTMTNALFVSGGITNVGSLRNVQLRRQGVTVSELDLYELLLRGDTSADQRLLPDDVLFIPPIGPTVGISGEVIRPAIYELKNETTSAEVLALSGGLLPTAFPRSSKIERINENGERTVIDVDMSVTSGQQTEVRNGDLLQINPILDRQENIVLAEGHLQRPGGFQWREGLRVSDLIGSVDTLLPNPDLQYALVVTEQPITRVSQVIELALGDALNNPGSAADIVLQPRDRVITFGATGDRAGNLAGLLAELNAEASFDNPPAVIQVNGSVRYPGAYPHVQNMTVGDMINAAGGMRENADTNYALIVRKRGNQGDVEVHDVISNSLNLNASFSVSAADTLLVFDANAPRSDLLDPVIRQLKSQSDSLELSNVVSASGQLKFPGEYPLVAGMSVATLIRAAGEFTESAQTATAELSRYEVDGRRGRIVDHTDVNLTAAGPDGQQMQLLAFDNLVIRQLPNWVAPESITLSGEVESPGSYSIAKGDSLSSVIARAGGLTAFADSNASVLLRESLRENERVLLQEYKDELEADLAMIALTYGSAMQLGPESGNETLNMGQGLLDDVVAVEPLGRLVIDLPAILIGDASEDVIARNGDQLFVPRTRQEVSILGEVNRPTSHLFNADLGVAEYIELSGGLTQRADEGRTYIIKANGQVRTYSESRWFFQGSQRIQAGDTIVVPFDVEPTNYLVTWTSISQVLFNLATSVLAINSVQK